MYFSMPQSSNKLSSFIGIILLLGIIGFTVFINFFAGEPVEIIEGEISKEAEEPYFESFSTADVTNFWKLENLHTEITNIDYGERITQLSINEIQETLDSLADSEIKNTEELDKNSFDEEFNLIGGLEFKHANHTNTKYYNSFKSFEISYFDRIESDSNRLFEIGKLFVNYQIESVTTEPEYGDFTFIHLKDGRRVFLIKNDAEIIGNKYYKKLLDQSEYLNDSTRMTYYED
jgi:hypothetical protein